MPIINLVEEMRQDMLEDARRDELIERRMRTDFDFFLTRIGFEELSEAVTNVRNQCKRYGYDFKDVLDSI